MGKFTLRALHWLSFLLVLNFLNASPALAGAAQCKKLAGMHFTPPGDATSMTIDSVSFVATKKRIPEHCLVSGHLDADLNFAVELPTKWNGKIRMEGHGGFAGYIPYLDFGLALHYAMVGTDGGNNGDPSTLLNRPDRQANLMYRSSHVGVLAGKEIVRAYYGTDAKNAFFEGCSRGGVEGMMLASKYPEDFDGIVAGAPTLDGGISRLWNMRALFPNGPEAGGVMTSDRLALLSKLVIQKCDLLDGRRDGIVGDPRVCNFSPADLPVCSGNVAGPNCFTKEQVAIFQKIHEGPQSNGRSIGAPYYFSGVEGYSWGDVFGVGEDILDYAFWQSGFPENPALFPDFYDVGMPSYAYWVEVQYLRYIVFSDPNYVLESFNFNDRPEVRQYVAAVSPQSPDADLSAYNKRGGKLLLWQGVGDSLVNYEITRQYYESSVTAAGGLPQLKSYDRLFAVPGTSHCGNGPGPWAFDPFPVLRQWVEKNQAPKFIVGYAPDTNTTQPICAYPKVAKLISPSADPAIAASYVCSAPAGEHRPDVN